DRPQAAPMRHRFRGNIVPAGSLGANKVTPPLMTDLVSEIPVGKLFVEHSTAHIQEPLDTGPQKTGPVGLLCRHFAECEFSVGIRPILSHEKVHDLRASSKCFFDVGARSQEVEPDRYRRSLFEHAVLSRSKAESGWLASLKTKATLLLILLI